MSRPWAIICSVKRSALPPGNMDGALQAATKTALLHNFLGVRLDGYGDCSQRWPICRASGATDAHHPISPARRNCWLAITLSRHRVRYACSHGAQQWIPGLLAAPVDTRAALLGEPQAHTNDAHQCRTVSAARSE